MNTADSSTALAQAPSTRAERLEAALARLNASRELLRAELMPPSHDEGGGEGARPRSPWRTRWRQLRRALHGWPVAAVATEALQRWWQSHPWYAAGNVLADGVLDQARPLLRRHPVASVLGAAALGAAVVVSKPWRWPLLRRQLQPMPGGIGRWLVAQLNSAPVQTALASLLLMALQPQGSQEPNESQGPEEPQEPAEPKAAADGTSQDQAAASATAAQNQTPA